MAATAREATGKYSRDLHKQARSGHLDFICSPGEPPKVSKGVNSHETEGPLGWGQGCELPWELVSLVYILDLAQDRPSVSEVLLTG